MPIFLAEPKATLPSFTLTCHLFAKSLSAIWLTNKLNSSIISINLFAFVLEYILIR